VVIAILIAGGIALNAFLYNKLYKGQPWTGSRLFYPVSRGYATDSNIDLADVNMARSSKWVLVSSIVVLVALCITVVIGAVINAIVR